MTPTERLARAMGYSTKVDAIARVQIDVSNSPPVEQWKVFDPRKDGAQGFEALAWLLKDSRLATHRGVMGNIGDGCDPADGFLLAAHNGTGPDLMRAVCDAAERVAEGSTCSS